MQESKGLINMQDNEELHDWLNQPSDNPHLSEDEIKELHEFLNEPL